jgi:hypothetical protein
MATLPAPVIEAMAHRSMRMHHMLWHTSRQAWPNLTEAERQVFRDHGWEPPRPVLRTPQGQIDSSNGCGEDFLFMHREMIADVDEILAGLHDPENPHVEGWPVIPGPEDTEFPVPPPSDPRFSESIRQAKGDVGLQRIIAGQARFTNPQVLRGMSLSQLGNEIEFGVHGTAHLRWAASLPEFRPGGGDPFNVDRRFDDPGYDWLADFYSSHVNPIFWKLHGWVDARIDDWMKANDKAGPVPWSFDPPWTGHMAHDHEHRHIAGLALRARESSDEADALASHEQALEETINALRAAGVREPTPFPVVE